MAPLQQKLMKYVIHFIYTVFCPSTWLLINKTFCDSGFCKIFVLCDLCACVMYGCHRYGLDRRVDNIQVMIIRSTKCLKYRSIGQAQPPPTYRKVHHTLVVLLKGSSWEDSRKALQGSEWQSFSGSFSRLETVPLPLMLPFTDKRYHTQQCQHVLKLSPVYMNFL